MTQWGLDTLFNPAKRHMDEEKRRLQSTREEVGDNSGGKRIDLESGKVTIRRQDDADDADDASEASKSSADGAAAESDQSVTTPDAVKAAPAPKSTREPTAAEIRAARRRGREPR